MKKLVVDVGSMLVVQYLIFFFVEIRLGEQATFTKFITNNYILTFWIIYLASRIVNCKIKSPAMRNKSKKSVSDESRKNCVNVCGNSGATNYNIGQANND